MIHESTKLQNVLIDAVVVYNFIASQLSKLGPVPGTATDVSVHQALPITVPYPEGETRIL